MKQNNADNFPKVVSTWPQLANLINHFSYYNGHPWLFRGVTDATQNLTPKIGRPTLRKRKKIHGSKGYNHLPYKPEDERAVLNMFKQQARPYLTSPPESELEWMAIAQHYGLPTRLLDWTDSLIVATWFAVEKAERLEKKEDSAIWVTRGVPSADLECSTPFDLAETRVYRPPHMSPRISAQGSVLMICPNPTEDVMLPNLSKVIIKRRAEFTLKKRLNACGINRRHLFPSLGGLTDHLTWMYKNNWLAGYKTWSSLQST